jgi:hypothetical protein
VTTDVATLLKAIDSYLLSSLQEENGSAGTASTSVV